MVKKKYRALRAIAFVLQVLAWVFLVLAILGTVGAIVAGLLNVVSIPALDNLNGGAFAVGGAVAGIATALGILIFGIIEFVLLLAASEYVYVQLDIEQNTRQGNEYLRQLVLSEQQSASPVAAYAPSGQTTPLPPEYPAQPTITVPTNPAPK